MHERQNPARRQNEAGNVLFMILLAVILIGLLTAAIQGSNNSESANIDGETLVIRASEVQRAMAEMERGVKYIIENGTSESDIRFAHPDASADYGDLNADADPSDQLFHASGGAANYRAVPADINDGSTWEFYGGTHIPGMGTASRAELIVVLPNVSEQLCTKINKINGQNGTPADTGGGAAAGSSPGQCLSIGALGRFDDAQQFYATPNTVDEATFEQDPSTSAARSAPQACVICDDGKRHVYHVLMSR